MLTSKINAKKPCLILVEKQETQNEGDKSYLPLLLLSSGRIIMQDGTEAKIRQDLSAEIVNLEESYRQLRSSLSAKDYDALIVASSLRAFKDSLDRASAFTLTLYNLHGHRVNIPWEQLFKNLDYALATIKVSPSAKQRDAVQTILSMSRGEIEQVLTYFAALKESLK
jgi:hypothetical protein